MDLAEHLTRAIPAVLMLLVRTAALEAIVDNPAVMRRSQFIFKPLDTR